MNHHHKLFQREYFMGNNAFPRRLSYHHSVFSSIPTNFLNELYRKEEINAKAIQNPSFLEITYYLTIRIIP
jgi:hypothetical protein